MDDYTYSHIIKNIENIRVDGKVNKYHEHILGKRCSIQYGIEPGRGGAMVVEPFGSLAIPRLFYTTIIRDVSEEPDGSIVMRTQNTIYTLVPNLGGEKR